MIRVQRPACKPGELDQFVCVNKCCKSNIPTNEWIVLLCVAALRSCRRTQFGESARKGNLHGYIFAAKWIPIADMGGYETPGARARELHTTRPV